MRDVILSVLIAFATCVSFAEEETPAKSEARTSEHAEMHEHMAKIHQKAADCLNSGKSEAECRKEFRSMCDEPSGPGRCGPWLMHQKMGKKFK